MIKQKISIWTDIDLDGAMSRLMFMWLYPKAEFDFNCARSTTLKDEYLNWQKTHKLGDYDRVIFADLDTRDIEKYIDEDNVEIYDHHESHVNDSADRYKHIKVKRITNNKCAATAIYNEHKELLTHLTHEQVKLLVLVADYDSYTLKYKESLNLNIVYWGYTGNRIEKFCADFKNGFSGFTQHQNNSIIIYYKKLESLIAELDIYTGRYKDYTAACCFCTTAHNDIASYVIKATGAQIAMLINPKTQTVSFRKREEDVKISMADIAYDLCRGGGHDGAAGGPITEEFLEYTKTFSKYEHTT